MNRRGDQGLLVVGLLIFLLICAIVGIALQGQQLGEASATLESAQTTLTAVADAQDAVSTSVANTFTAADARATEVAAALESSATARADEAAAAQAELTAQAEALVATQTQAAESLRAEATAQAEALSITQTAAFQEGLSIANATNRPAFEAFSTAVAVTQAALSDAANATQSALLNDRDAALTQVAGNAALQGTVQAQQVIVATYEAVSAAFAATSQAIASATATVKALTPTPSGGAGGLPVTVGDLLLEQTFSTDEAPISIDEGDALVIAEDGQLTIRVEVDSITVFSPTYLLADDNIYAEVGIDIRACTPDGSFGLAITNSDASQSYQVHIECALNAWQISWFDAEDTSTPVITLAYGSISAAPVADVQRVGLLWQANVLTVYLNGQRLGTLRDTRLGEGFIGLLAGTRDVPGTIVYFDNLRVWALP